MVVIDREPDVETESLRMWKARKGEDVEASGEGFDVMYKDMKVRRELERELDTEY